MKHLGRFLEDTADQIFSTAILVFFGYCMVQGVIALFKNTPPWWSFLAVFILGFTLGVIKFLKYKTPTYSENRKENKVED